jgi:hypothetical protein
MYRYRLQINWEIKKNLGRSDQCGGHVKILSLCSVCTHETNAERMKRVPRILIQAVYSKMPEGGGAVA